MSSIERTKYYFIMINSYLLLMFSLAITCRASILLPDNIDIDSVPLTFDVNISTPTPVIILKIDPCTCVFSNTHQLYNCPTPIPFFNNTIPLLFYGACEYDAFFSPIIDAGYTTILFTQGTAQQAGWFTSSKEVINKLTVPIYEVSGIYVSYFTTNTSIILQGTVNVYEELFQSAWFTAFQVIIGAVILFSLSLTLYKFIAYCRYRVFHYKSLPHVNAITLICYFLLLCAYIVDPAYSRHFYSFFAGGLIITISIPLLMISCCLTALFWLQIVNEVVNNLLWKGKYYIICIVLSITVTVITMLLGILASFRTVSTIIVLVIIFTFFLAMSIVYVIAGIKLLKAVHGTKNIKQSKANNYRRIAAGFVLCSGCSFLYLVMGVVNLTTPFVPKPPYSVILSAIFMQFFGVLNGMFQILFLKTPKSNKLSSIQSKTIRQTNAIESNKEPPSTFISSQV